jgi:hypothetical protein
MTLPLLVFDAMKPYWISTLLRRTSSACSAIAALFENGLPK